ncbi:MAG: hypothetical protein EOO03_02995 [Chitinophagaceae bacterium]|nr:MAG: hypothetical protein EOO03_02995 [Chitinophagaceae bacterium]
MNEMENNFYRDDFEQMLRDTTEEFRMYPARKVWHSIYNDLHPDRKWPSFAVSLLLLTAILYVGVTNNDQISKRTVALLTVKPVADLQLAANDLSANVGESNSNADAISSTPVIQLKTLRSAGNDVPLPVAGKDAEPLAASSTASISNTDYAFSTNNNLATNSITSDVADDATVPETIAVKESTKNNLATPAANGHQETVAGSKTIAQTDAPAALVPANGLALPVALTQESNQTQNALSPTEKAWIEDHAFHNVRNPNKWKTNLSFHYYVTPSIGYRHLSQQPGVDALSSSFVVTTDNDEVTQQAAPNLELGGVMVLGVGQRLKIKSGVQLNLTNYITYAHDVKHPTQTMVPMNEGGIQYQQLYSTTLGNVLGSNYTKLNNKTVQLSIPIGIDYKVAGTNKIKWYMGAGIQPSYVLGGNAYLISTDNKNFVQDDAMLRKWNASANLESFISIKAPSGVDINVGPQLRYQLFSTYSSNYSYTEKLYNLGIKIGVTKKL